MLDRELSDELRFLAREYPVLTLLGPRQSGKTTLCRAIFPDHRYINLEEPEIRALALADPRAFFKQNPPPLILDEIQRAPELCSWIQVIVDERKTKGEFILTGSSQPALLAAISQSLAGRNALATLYPFTIGELRSGGIETGRDDGILAGFFPRVHAEKQEPTRAYRSYIQTYIERDIRQILNIKSLAAFERFLGFLAGRIGQLVNLSSLAADTGVSSTTLAEWLNALESSFLVYRLRPFHANLGKRLVKAPKLYFSDVGLASALIGLKTTDAVARDKLLGNIFENLVVMEAVKQFCNHGETPPLWFYRDQNGREIDLIVDRNRQLIPIEIKASMTWNPEFAKGVTWFQELAAREAGGQPPARALVVYAGERRVESERYEALPFGDLRVV